MLQGKSSAALSVEQRAISEKAVPASAAGRCLASAFGVDERAWSAAWKPAQILLVARK